MPITQQVGLLDRAVIDLDSATISRILKTMLRTDGVVETWTEVLIPVLTRRGEVFDRTADGICAEHLLSECTRSALSAVVSRRRRWNRCRPVLLAAADGEQHVLPLYALAAALAEVSQPSVLLGAAVPSRALYDAADRLNPGVIFLWSQLPDTARRADLPVIGHDQHHGAPTLVLGGPGWPPPTTGRVSNLIAAVDACCTPPPPQAATTDPDRVSNVAAFAISSAAAVGAGRGAGNDRMGVPPFFLVNDRDAAVLRGWVGDPAQPTLGRRAQIVLLCADGNGPSAVAAWMQCGKQTVIMWRDRYIAKGLNGLRHEPHSGRPVSVNAARVVLGTLQRRDPLGASWSTRSLAAELGISNVAVSKIWRDWGIRPEPGGRVSLRTEPVLDAAVLAVLGLHIDPPVYVFAIAVAVADHSSVAAATADAPAPRHELGGLLDDVLASAQPSSDGQAALHRFLAMLDRAHDQHTVHASATTEPTSTTPVGPVRPVRTALVAAGDTDSVRELTRARSPVDLHTVTDVTTWAHLLRVGCLLAGAEPDGETSVNALRAALPDHTDGPFTWTPTATHHDHAATAVEPAPDPG